MQKVKYLTRPIGADTWLIEQHMLTSEASAYLIVGDEKAMLIDTGLALPGFFEAVGGLTDKPIEVLCTHAHLDHIGANRLYNKTYLLEEDRGLLTLQTTPDYLAGMVNSAVPGIARWLLKKEMTAILRDTTAAGSYEYINDGALFDLGGRSLEVIATPGHTRGSLCVLDRENRRLFSGDTVCDWGILLHLDWAASPETFLHSVERLRRMVDRFDEIWPGHHKKPLPVDYLDDYINCARSIVNGTATYGRRQQAQYAKYGRVLITVPAADRKQ
ncbi:MAG: MBL fold metallo-hydrolase [Lachnospiraceae bacterium]|jgi:glyoxylase-like metal-dependent hydrolase (beta-lactamase superfamily II)|nr:MBL fold metallo-hydrolase [Lachnospiraceae bacterium]